MSNMCPYSIGYTPTTSSASLISSDHFIRSPYFKLSQIKHSLTIPALPGAPRAAPLHTPARTSPPHLLDRRTVPQAAGPSSAMIQLLFSLLAAEAALVLALLFPTPVRRLALLAIDRAKRGRGPVMAKTIAGTMLLVLVSAFYSVAKIRRREGELGQLTPTDQVLASRHLLEASLMGIYAPHDVPPYLFSSSTPI
jgi:hypothetical protein